MQPKLDEINSFIHNLNECVHSESIVIENVDLVQEVSTSLTKYKVHITIEYEVK